MLPFVVLCSYKIMEVNFNVTYLFIITADTRQTFTSGRRGSGVRMRSMTDLHRHLLFWFIYFYFYLLRPGCKHIKLWINNTQEDLLIRYMQIIYDLDLES